MQPHSIREPYFPANLEDYAPWVTTHGLTAPYGKCQCGCGEDAPISTFTRRKKGIVQGKPARYIHGHQSTLYRRLHNPNPSGLCMCGCGQSTPIANSTLLGIGRVKGFPTRFVGGHRINPAGESAEDRFWFYCVDNGSDQCWEWTGTRHPFGYGHFQYRGETISAHRFSYELHCGPIPEGEGYHGTCVLHKCDNPSCCNPDHLFLGTSTDNVDDMVGKRRHAYGERNGNAKLSEQDAIDIKNLHDNGWSLCGIARQYGISDVHAGNIAKGMAWSHLEGEDES